MDLRGDQVLQITGNRTGLLDRLTLLVPLLIGLSKNIGNKLAWIFLTVLVGAPFLILAELSRGGYRRHYRITELEIT
jgi:hypothetical protein